MEVIGPHPLLSRLNLKAGSSTRKKLRPGVVSTEVHCLVDFALYGFPDLTGPRKLHNLLHLTVLVCIELRMVAKQNAVKICAKGFPSPTRGDNVTRHTPAYRVTFNTEVDKFLVLLLVSSRCLDGSPVPACCNVQAWLG